MTALVDRTGQRYGRLVAKRYLGNLRWECVCDCGTVCTPLGISLGRGHTLSCGCLAKDRAKEANTTHGHTRSRAYIAWVNMRKRCGSAVNNNDFAWYGGRGITVCKRWQTFEKFYADMGDPPDGMSLDRINSKKGYSPANCRWATAQEQAHNSRVTKLSDADVLAIRTDTRPYKDIAATYDISKGHVCKVRSGKFYPRLLNHVEV
jgi:hypothetical protein